MVQRFLGWMLLLTCATPAPAQIASVQPASVQTPAETLAQDAAAYALLEGVTPDQAARELGWQETSVPATDRLQLQYRDRLAGLWIEHQPTLRLVVLLTGSDPVPDTHITAAGLSVPVSFRTGALATRTELLTALTQHQADLRGAVPKPPGMGLDPRTGAILVFVDAGDLDIDGQPAMEARLSAIAGVPVHVELNQLKDVNMAVEGGARVVGLNPADGKHYVCTTGFTVTDGARDGVLTAAHCPDQLSYLEPHGGPEVPLTYVGQWGWGYQDVQVEAADTALPATFYADTAKSLQRAVTGQRPRASTRAGDVVCHRGERTGYSCAEVRLTDFAPAGDLCGGACLPTWVAVNGPTCKGGDSGSPVFLGTTAFGVLKGGSYRADGGCVLWFYMSTDYLPSGWSLLTVESPPLPPPSSPAPLPDTPVTPAEEPGSTVVRTLPLGVVP